MGVLHHFIGFLFIVGELEHIPCFHALMYLWVCIWRRGGERERERERGRKGGKREEGGGEKGEEGRRRGKGKRVEERARKKRRNEGRREKGKRKEVGIYGQDTQCATKLPIFLLHFFQFC